MNGPVLFVTRKAHFNAAHKLFNPLWSKEENEACFGKCANEHWHGHNFDLYVTIKGIPSVDTGFVMDLKKLKVIIENEVVEHLDHKNLNLDVPEFKDLNPTAENIVWVIWNKLKNRLDAAYTLSVRLYETPRNFVEFNG